MYILTQTVPYAETERIKLLAVSASRENLEEFILSIYEEAKEFHDEPDYLKMLMDTFEIHKVLYIDK